METKEEERLAEGEPKPPQNPARELIAKVAQTRVEPGKPGISALDAEDAAEFLLGAFTQTPELTHLLTVNVGGVGAKRRDVNWRIRALDGAVIRKIREQAEAVVRRQGSTGAGATSAGFMANVRVVIEGSIEPDVKALARQAGLADPADFLETALQHKQGLIDQIAGSILTLSGYDNDDVNDALEVRAAGN